MRSSDFVALATVVTWLCTCATFTSAEEQHPHGTELLDRVEEVENELKSLKEAKVKRLRQNSAVDSIIKEIKREGVTEEHKDEMIRRLSAKLEANTASLKKTMEALEQKTAEVEELKELVYERQRGKRLSNVTREAGLGSAEDFLLLKPSSSSYIFGKKGSSWDDARSICQKLGGDLASLWDAEWEYVYKQISHPSSTSDVWLGASAATGKWLWLTGEPVSPNNFLGRVLPGTGSNTRLEAHNHAKNEYKHKYVNGVESTNYNFLCKINSY